MTTPEDLGMIRPSGSDLINGGDDAISQNAKVVAEVYDALLGSIDDTTILKDPIGLSVDLNTVTEPGLYPVRFGGNPNGVGLAGFMLVGQSMNGTLVQVTQLFMAQPNGLYFRAGRDGLFRPWDRMATLAELEALEAKNITRRVLHQLSFPGNGNLRDSAQERHVRVPLKLFATVDTWDLTIKNFNEQTKTNYGDLNFTDVYIGKAMKDGAGTYRQNFDGPPTLLGKLTATGAGATRRYVIEGIGFQLEKNTEYLLSYGYVDPNPAVPNHLGIGGAWLGVDSTMTGRYDPPVSNAWSVNVPLDVYLTLHASASIPAYAYVDSSSGTGVGSDNPTRDVWGWRHSEAVGALPVLLGHSGSTIKAWAEPTRYVYQKLGSTFDKVDRVFDALGSNDGNVYKDLPGMIADSAALSKLLREFVSESITYVNYFPRRSEAADVRAVRLGWDAHLFNLPNGSIQAIDRARFLKGADGLLKPELDSGDGTHVNTLGQALMGEAAIIGAAIEKEINRYTVSEAVGRTVTVWDYLNNREQLVYGDTGVRDISGLLAIAGTVVSFTLRRVGHTCFMALYNLQASAGGSGNLAVIPSGFRPTTTFGAPAQGLSSRWQVTNAGNVQAYNWTTSAVVGSLTWATSEPWPNSLPGVPG